MVVIQGTYEDIIHYYESTTVGTYFEFTFSFVGHNEIFRELDRFLWESKHVLRFQNTYVGNVLIELSGWNQKADSDFNEYFDAFMYFLKSKCNALQVTFFAEGQCSKSLYDHLKNHFDIHLIDPEKGEVKIHEVHHTRIGFSTRED